MRLAKVHKTKKRACAFTMAEALCAQKTHVKNNNSIAITVVGWGVRGKWGLAGVKLHPVPRSMLSRIVPICRRFDCIRCSVPSLVMPHSATIIASGDDISTTISWNSGV